jgi:cytochrome c-type biogenesis protein CcmE
MKTIHIVALVLIAASIAALISFMGNVSTNETIASAEKTPGKFVHLSVMIDKSQPFVYDAVKDPNYLSFTALDTLGNKINVVYHNAKPTDMEKSERLGIAGRVVNGQFDCQQILLKCPSKYKDDPNAAKQNLQNSTESRY